MTALQDRDISGLAVVYEQTKRGVFASAYAILRDRSAAEDVMQETYVKVAEGIDGYRPGSNAAAWIVTIARNLALREYNKRKHLVPLDGVEETRSYSDDNDGVFLSATLSVLDMRERQAVILHVYDGFKHKEIARIMEIPLGTELWIYNKAIKKLKTHFEKEGRN